MSIRFPNVPTSAGVPPVLRLPLAILDGVATTLAQASGGVPAASADWGIFDSSGQRVMQPDSIVSLEFVGEHRIADYPTEGGGFQSYNKVEVPFSVRLSMTKGGTVAERTAFLAALEDLRSSLTLCDVATPERVYVGVNLTRVGQSRNATAGAGMVTVEVMFEQVRETVAVAYSTAPTSSAATGGTADAPIGAPVSATPSTLPAPTSSVRAAGAPARAFWKPKPPAGAVKVNRGAVQALAVPNSAKLVKLPGSAQAHYVYDRPIR